MALTSAQKKEWDDHVVDYGLCDGWEEMSNEERVAEVEYWFQTGGHNGMGHVFAGSVEPQEFVDRGLKAFV